MSLRPRRALVGLITGCGCARGAAGFGDGRRRKPDTSRCPAHRRAAIQPSRRHLSSRAAPRRPRASCLSEAPGLAANLNANPSCITGAQQLTPPARWEPRPSRQTRLPPVTGNVYLVPAAADRATSRVSKPRCRRRWAGIRTAALSLRTTPTVGVNLTTTFPNPGSGVVITELSLTLNPTLNGVPFTALPTSCGAAISTAAITYYSGTTAVRLGIVHADGMREPEVRAEAHRRGHQGQDRHRRERRAHPDADRR